MNKPNFSEAESELVRTIASHVRREFGRTAALAFEVPSHGRARTDVVVAIGGELLGIEAKIGRWRRAVGQAILNRYCVERSYVAMWRLAIRPHLLEEAEFYGLGVIAVDSRRIEVVLAADLSVPDPAVRRRIASAFAG